MLPSIACAARLPFFAERFSHRAALTVQQQAAQFVLRLWIGEIRGGVEEEFLRDIGIGVQCVGDSFEVVFAEQYEGISDNPRIRRTCAVLAASIRNPAKDSKRAGMVSAIRIRPAEPPRSMHGILPGRVSNLWRKGGGWDWRRRRLRDPVALIRQLLCLQRRNAYGKGPKNDTEDNA